MGTHQTTPPAISRGFRRLSVFVGVIGFVVMGCILLLNYDPSGSDSLPAAAIILVCSGGIPAVFTLFVGWVVAGFQDRVS